MTLGSVSIFSPNISFGIEKMEVLPDLQRVADAWASPPLGINQGQQIKRAGNPALLSLEHDDEKWEPVFVEHSCDNRKFRVIPRGIENDSWYSVCIFLMLLMQMGNMQWPQ